MTQSPGVMLANPRSVTIVSAFLHCLASIVIGLKMRNNPMTVLAVRLTPTPLFNLEHRKLCVHGI